MSSSATPTTTFSRLGFVHFNLFYVNAGLLAVLGLLIEKSNPALKVGPLVLCLLVLGFFVSFSFIISIWCGVIYMQRRKEKIFEIEEDLLKAGIENFSYWFMPQMSSRITYLGI